MQPTHFPLSVDGKCLKIRYGAQKLSEAIFCRPLNPQIFPGVGCKKSLYLIFALLNFPSTDNVSHNHPLNSSDFDLMSRPSRFEIVQILTFLMQTQS